MTTLPERKWSKAFAFGELAWYLRGDNTVAPLAFYAPKIAEFSDDGTHLAGAYGPRLVTGYQSVLQRLRADPASRQAVITLYDSRVHNYGNSKDIPCTVALQFLNRNGALHCICTMRSNDLILGDSV